MVGALGVFGGLLVWPVCALALGYELAAVASLTVVFGLYCALCLRVYHVTTCERYAAFLDRETRCRKCGYILRGLAEPRCPECGERI